MRIVRQILRDEVKDKAGPLIFLSLLMIAMVGFDVVMPWPFKILIDNVLSSDPTPLAASGIFSFLQPIFNSRYFLGFFAVLIYFASTFLLEIVTYIHGSQTKKIIKDVTADFSKKAFKSLQSLAIGFYKKQQVGDYIYRLGYDVSAIGDLLEHGLLPLVTSLLYLVVTLTIMALINLQLMFLAMAALPFLAFCLYSFNVYITHATKRSEFMNSASFSFIEEALTHLKVIQAFSQERRESRRFAQKTDTTLATDVTLYNLDFLITLLIGIIITISYSFIILYGIRAVFSGTLTTGLLVVFIFYLDNLTIPILSIIDSVTLARESFVKVNRMEEFFSKKTHLDYHAGEIKKITDTTIQFDDVTVGAERDKKNILRNVSFTIERNKRTVIMGANGSGKTSTVNLLMRFIDKPTSGRIYLGGMDLQKYDLANLRESIAFVPQEITLFNDTIRANIAFGSPNSSPRDIREAARLADADHFINSLPGKYDFKVGELGEFLSGGQRQRLMLARALMKKDAKILLFDETLSALDVEARKVILQNLYDFSRNKTMIIVSNIFEVINAADHVIVFNKGKLIYAGPSSRLPKEASLYRMIVDSQ